VGLRPRKNVLVTGRPGIGKTTAVIRAVEGLRRVGVRVGGLVTREERVGGVRTGFVMVDVSTGEQAYLARVGEGRPRVGRYVVFVQELERLGVRAVLSATAGADVVVIDEIGPMELKSQAFKEAVLRALDSPKPVIATIHHRAADDPFGRSVLSRGDCHLVTLTESNRDAAPQKIIELVLAAVNPSLRDPLFGGG